MDKYIMSILVCFIFCVSTIFMVRVFYHFYQENKRIASYYHSEDVKLEEIYQIIKKEDKSYIYTKSDRAFMLGDMLWDIQSLLKLRQ